MELSSSKLEKLWYFFWKKVLIFQKGTCKARKTDFQPKCLIFYTQPILFQQKCLICYIQHGNYWNEENLVLAFVCFWKGRIKALRKKLLEHFTAIFGILHDLSVWKIEDSGNFRKKSEESGLSTQIGMGIHIFALLPGSYIQKKQPLEENT